MLQCSFLLKDCALYFRSLFRPGVGVCQEAFVISSVDLRAEEGFLVFWLGVDSGSVVAVGLLYNLREHRQAPHIVKFCSNLKDGVVDNSQKL